MTKKDKKSCQFCKEPCYNSWCGEWSITEEKHIEHLRSKFMGVKYWLQYCYDGAQEVKGFETEYDALKWLAEFVIRNGGREFYVDGLFYGRYIMSCKNHEEIDVFEELK